MKFIGEKNMREGMKEGMKEVFIKAYNEFDSRPLKGESLKKYYVDDFSKDISKRIINTITISERFRKILIIGHTGCGKSTILNNIIDKLGEQYHIVDFSISDQINLMDVNTIDVLLAIYIQLVKAVKNKIQVEKKIISKVLSDFDEVTSPIRQTLSLKEVGVSLLKTISFKMLVEKESRSEIRKAYIKKGVELMQHSISEISNLIAEETNKDILIVIDDLDKLKDKFAKKIFFDEVNMLFMPECKIIFTFPISSFHDPKFNRITDKFESEFIRLVNLYDYDGKYNKESEEILKKIVLKRIDSKFISVKALEHLIIKSGGLVRDLIKYMQDACRTVLVEELDSITEEISKEVVREKINEYYRLFDFVQYEEDVKKIIKTQTKKDVKMNNFLYLLRYLFVLVYGKQSEQIWFDTHPCLKELLK